MSKEIPNIVEAMVQAIHEQPQRGTGLVWSHAQVVGGIREVLGQSDAVQYALQEAFRAGFMAAGGDTVAAWAAWSVYDPSEGAIEAVQLLSNS